MATSESLSAKDWYERGHALRRAGNNAGALEAFKLSIRLNHHVAAPWIGLAQLLDSNNQLEEARQCLREATKADPKDLMSRRLLAQAHQTLGFVEDARREFETALTLDPNSAPTYHGLGKLLEDIGKPEEAATAYRKALELDPDSHKEALARLLGLSRHVDTSAEIIQAENQISELPPKEKALIGYGLGKALEQQKNYDSAFEAYSIANQARRDITGNFNRRAFDIRVKNMITLFSADFFKAREGWGNISKRPIFIVGLPRSGTTLTEQIISSHASCFGAGELNALTDLATGTPDRLGKSSPPWPACASQLNRQQIADLGYDYLQQSSTRAPENALRVVDKQPLNFWHLGLIAIALPNAHIIHCQRDIRDCGFSIFSQNFNLKQNWSTSLDDIAYYWNGYKKLMQHFEKVSKLKILNVSYEETVHDLKSSAQELLSFIDLPWDENVLRFHENNRAVQTPSRWQVRQPVYRSSLDRWQRYGDKLGALITAAQQHNNST